MNPLSFLMRFLKFCENLALHHKIIYDINIFHFVKANFPIIHIYKFIVINYSKSSLCTKFVKIKEFNLLLQTYVRQI